jgi:hypothetical protein
MLAVTAGGMLGLAAQFLLEVLEVRCNWRGRWASNRGWVWQRNGPNTRKQPPGNRNRNAQQTIKARRVAEEGSSNDSTVQQSSTQHTQVVGVCDGLLKPEPVVLADQDRHHQRITPNVPTERARAWAAKLPSYQDTLSDRTVPLCWVPCCQASCCLSCILYTAEEAKAKESDTIRTGREVSMRVVRGVRASTEASLVKLTHACFHQWPRRLLLPPVLIRGCPSNQLDKSTSKVDCDIVTHT